ncbi:MAG: hypothetical protein ACRDX9_11435, partial [Acidimicrobiia bacterium]
RRILDQRVVTGAILLPVALWVQEALGHMPFAVSTAVHVPLGVAIFGSSVVLALAAGQATRSRSASPPGAASGG